MIALALAQKPVTIGEMVVADYRKAEVFRKYGLDYCCGGKKSLEEACRKKGIEAQKVQLELDAIDHLPAAPHQDFESWPMDALTEHILHKHHQYVSDAIPMLYELSAKVARVHGERHPELIEIAGKFNAVAEELQLHMQKEEQILFPHMIKMALAQRQGALIPRPLFGSVENPVRMMESEHESAGAYLEDIRQLSHDFTPPVDACTSYRVLYAKLLEFEQDLHQHVHLENNILFPKAMQLEKQEWTA